MHLIPILPDIRLIQQPDTGYLVRLDTGYPACYDINIFLKLGPFHLKSRIFNEKTIFDGLVWYGNPSPPPFLPHILLNLIVEHVNGLLWGGGEGSISQAKLSFPLKHSVRE